MDNLPDAMLLDRDGVLNVRRPDHVTRWNEFAFLPGVHTAVASLAALGIPVFVLTNQAIINRGIASRATVDAIHRRMCASLALRGGAIAEVVLCPHRPDEGCECRKPAPGMLRDLAARHGLDLARCLFVGDTCTDLLAGRAAGCPTALVLTGQGREEHERTEELGLRGHLVAPDLATLVRSFHRSDRMPVAPWHLAATPAQDRQQTPGN